jgi:hypothetical protein
MTTMSGVFSEPVPVPVVWEDLSAGEAFDTWTDLGGWVTWLVRRFRLRPREVPPCWFRHAAVVEELTALWGSWRVAYGEDQPATSAAEWLHMFFDARLRLAEWMARAGCTATEHRDDPDVAWADDDPELGRHIGADCAARSAPPFRPARIDGIEL